MIKDGVYILKEDSTPMKDVDFKKGQELEVVGNVIYMNGFPLPIQMQGSFNKWITENQKLFQDDTRS